MFKRDESGKISESDMFNSETKWIRERRSNALKLRNEYRDKISGSEKTSGGSEGINTLLKRKIRFAGDIKFPVDKGSGQLQTVGLALSGGGIRSAVFNLGLIQALQRWNVFIFIDYLSTVSGGGYIGSCLTWFMSVFGRFPFGINRVSNISTEKNAVSWLRMHGEYLTHGSNITFWSFIAALSRGIFINLLMIIPLFFLLLKFLSNEIQHPALRINILGTIADLQVMKFTGFTEMINISVLLLLLVLVVFIISTCLSRIRSFTAARFQLRLNKWTGSIICVSLIFVIIGTLPYAYNLISNHKFKTISGLFVSGTGIITWVIKKLDIDKENPALIKAGITGGASILVYGIFLLLYHCVRLSGYNENLQAVLCDGRFILAYTLVIILIFIFSDINIISLHKYYRDTLVQAFMPSMKKLYPEDVNAAAVGANPDTFRLEEIKNTAGNPYHIINANVLLTNARDEKLRTRGGDNFIFSPLHCGSAGTCYRETKDYIGGNIDLGTAFSVSGAAVDPNTRSTKSLPIIFLMTLLNIRLGYWIMNPVKNTRHKWLKSGHFYLWFIFIEMFIFGLHEKRRSIHLADGGHFENLGLYELVRRKCRYIIVSDASADPGYTFSDLARAIELVRTDFGVKVDLDIDIEDLIPDKETGISKRPCVTGTVYYPDGAVSQLIYIKPVMIDKLPPDITAYRKRYTSFPNESTADQFFDEVQFEAYRELGYQSGTCIFRNEKVINNIRNDIEYASVEDLITMVNRNIKTGNRGKTEPDSNRQ